MVISTEFKNRMSEAIEKIFSKIKDFDTSSIENSFLDTENSLLEHDDSLKNFNPDKANISTDEDLFKEIINVLPTDIQFWNDILTLLRCYESQKNYTSFKSLEGSISLDTFYKEEFKQVFEFFCSLKVVKKMKFTFNNLPISLEKLKNFVNNLNTERNNEIRYNENNDITKESSFALNNSNSITEEIDLNQSGCFNLNNNDFYNNCLGKITIEANFDCKSRLKSIKLSILYYHIRVITVIWIDLLLRNPFKLLDLLSKDDLIKIVSFLLDSFQCFIEKKYKKFVLKALSLVCREEAEDKSYKRFIVYPSLNKSIDITSVNIVGNCTDILINSHAYNNESGNKAIDKEISILNSKNSSPLEYEFKYFIYNLEVTDVYYYCFLKQLSTIIEVPLYYIEQNDSNTVKRYKIKILTSLFLNHKPSYNNKAEFKKLPENIKIISNLKVSQDNILNNLPNGYQSQKRCSLIDLSDLNSIINFLINFINYNDVKLGWTLSKCLYKISRTADSDSFKESIKQFLKDEIFSDEQRWINILTILSFCVLDGMDIGSINFVKTSLEYDNEIYLKASAIRESTLFLLWACVKSNVDISDYFNTVIFMSLFDKELNCRRAAASVVQEYIGRYEYLSNYSFINRNDSLLNKSVFFTNKDTSCSDPNPVNQITQKFKISCMSTISNEYSKISSSSVINRSENLKLFNRFTNKYKFITMLIKNLYSNDKNTRTLMSQAISEILCESNQSLENNKINFTLESFKLQYSTVSQIDGTHKLCYEILSKVNNKLLLDKTVSYFLPTISTFVIDLKNYKQRNFKTCVESYLKIMKYFDFKIHYDNLMFLLNRNYDPEQLRRSSLNKLDVSNRKVCTYDKNYEKLCFNYNNPEMYTYNISSVINKHGYTVISIEVKNRHCNISPLSYDKRTNTETELHSISPLSIDKRTNTETELHSISPISYDKRTSTEPGPYNISPISIDEKTIIESVNNKYNRSDKNLTVSSKEIPSISISWTDKSSICGDQESCLQNNLNLISLNGQSLYENYTGHEDTLETIRLSFNPFKNELFSKTVLGFIQKNPSFILINSNNNQFRNEVIAGLLKNIKNGVYIDYSIKSLRYLDAYDEIVQETVKFYLEDYTVSNQGDIGHFNRKEALEYFLNGISKGLIKSINDELKTYTNLITNQLNIALYNKNYTKNDINLDNLSNSCSTINKHMTYNNSTQNTIADTKLSKDISIVQENSTTVECNEENLYKSKVITKVDIRNYLILYLSDKSKYLRDFVLSLFTSTEFKEYCNIVPSDSCSTYTMNYDDLNSSHINNIFNKISKETSIELEYKDNFEIFYNDTLLDISFKRFFEILKKNLETVSYEKAFYKSLFSAFSKNDFFVRGILQSLAVRGGETKKIILNEIEVRGDVFKARVKELSKRYNIELK